MSKQKYGYFSSYRSINGSMSSLLRPNRDHSFCQEGLSNIRAKDPPASTTNLEWVQNCISPGNVQNRALWEIPLVSNQTVQTFDSWIYQLPKMFLRNASGGLGNPYSTIKSILEFFDVSQHGNMVISDKKHKKMLNEKHFPQSCMDNMFSILGFPLRNTHLRDFPFTCQDLQALRALVFPTLKTQEWFINMNHRSQL